MERLIKSVQKRPCLWNTDLKEYKRIDLREQAWQDVSNECGLSDAKETKEVWRKLRDRHRQAIKRRNTTGNSIWKYEELMEYLVPTMRYQHKRPSIERQDDQADESYDYYIQEEDTVPHKKPRLQARQSEEADVDGQDPLDPSNDSFSTNNAMKTFFQSMLQTTLELPEQLQLRIQRRIFNVVMDVKEDFLAMNSSKHQNPVITSANSKFQYVTVGSRASSPALSSYSQSVTSCRHSRSRNNAVGRPSRAGTSCRQSSPSFQLQSNRESQNEAVKCENYELLQDLDL